jgi:hypothetical protein
MKFLLQAWTEYGYIELQTEDPNKTLREFKENGLEIKCHFIKRIDIEEVDINLN